MRSKIKTCSSIATLLLLFSGGYQLAQANSLVYSPIGTPNPVDYTFTATSTGSVTAYFYSESAGDTDVLIIEDTTLGTSVEGLVNQTSSVGESISLAVNAGNTLVFELDNESTGTILSSDASLNADGDNHIYSVPYTYSSSDPSIPSGTFGAFEDLLASQGSDFDYNDEDFVFTNVSVSTAPEPTTMALFGVALVGLAGLRLYMKVS